MISVAHLEKPQLAVRQSLPSSTTTKQQLSPRQSSPLSSPRQSTSISASTNQKPLLPMPTIKPAPVSIATTTAAPSKLTLQNQPQLPKSPPPTVLEVKSVPVTVSTSSKSPTPAKRAPPTIAPKPMSPVVSPMSPNVDFTSHLLSQKATMDTASSSESNSPSPSPRQPTHSVRSPPPVAPKPRKQKEPEITKEENLNEPIETEIFTSINSRNESVPSGTYVLPGCVTYASVPANSTEKTGWIPGVVSSTDIKKGKDDIVSDTEAPLVNVDHNIATDVHISSTAQTNTDANSHASVDLKSQQNEDKTLEEQSKPTKEFNDNILVPIDDVVVEVNEQQTEAVQKISDMEKNINESATADGSLLNRSRTFSTSSNASSYTDFKECDVEDDLIREEITEEDEHVHNKVDNKSEDEHYESDFEEEEVNSEEHKKIKALAESIVSNVISSLKDIDLLSANSIMDEEVKNVEHDEEQDKAPLPTLPQYPPPSLDIQQAPDSQDVPPPLPKARAPGYETVPATVVDMALYPDSDDHSSEDNVTKELIDVVNAPVVVNELHAGPPVDFVDVTLTFEQSVNDKTDSSFEQVGKSTTEGDNSATEQLVNVNSESSNVNNSNEKEDQSVSNVISMYSNLDSSWNDKNGVNEETNNNEYKVIDASEVVIGVPKADSILEAESCDSVRSQAGSDDYRNDITDLESNATDNTNDPDIDEVGPMDNLSDINSDLNGVSRQIVEDRTDKTDGTYNGQSSVNEVERRPATDQTNNRTSSRPMSVSRVDEILSQTADIERGKYSPEIDRMIRCKLLCFHRVLAIQGGCTYILG